MRPDAAPRRSTVEQHPGPEPRRPSEVRPRVLLQLDLHGRRLLAEVGVGPACDLSAIDAVAGLARAARARDAGLVVVEAPLGFRTMLGACGLDQAVLGPMHGQDGSVTPDETPAPHPSPPRPEPMMAELGELPVDDEGWRYEPKWDGMRVVIEVDHGRLRLWSRSGREVTTSFPELEPLAEVAPRAVLDGEVVAIDDDGRPSFARLQQRFGVEDPAEARRRAARVPVEVVVFDLLVLDDQEAWRLPYDRRRELLEALVDPAPPVQLTPSWHGDGARWLAAAREAGLEGLVAKRGDAPYRPGRRSSSWRKIKIRQEQEFVVCGWMPGQGRRDGGIGSLVLGCGAPGARRWVGNAGSGLDDAALEHWRELLDDDEVDQHPFEGTVRHAALRGAHWVRPRHVVQVAFGEWTTEGRLRHPTVLGPRPDVHADDVRCEGRPG